MSTPTVTIGSADTSVTITWVEPGDHAAPIDYYEILLLKSDGSFTTETTNCDGSDAAIILALSCEIPMPTIISSTSWPVDTLIKVKARAHNGNGWGEYSELNTAGATIETVPTQMAAPVFVLAGSDSTQTTMSWSALTGTAAGGLHLAVTSYVLEWDAGAGNGAWSTHITTTSLTATSAGLPGGGTYSYRIAAQNKYGLGVVSDALSVLIAEAPAVPAAPTTTQETNYVRIAWTAPVDNHATIDQYQILIADSDGLFVEDTAVCDGAEQTVVDGLHCLVPMTALWAEPFTLAQSTTVQAKILAHNERGWSGTSDANTAGAAVETVPHAMDSPTRGVTTSDAQI